MGNEGETSKQRIERLVGEGKITREAVSNAERLWQERLQEGITIPDGESIVVGLGDLYHVIVDPRISRKPERIEQLLTGIFEIRSAREGRRAAFSRWEEGGKMLFGIVIIEIGNTVRTMHLVDNKKLAREMKKGDLLWKL